MPAVNLTAGAAVDLAALVDVASSITGRTIRHTVVDDETYRSGLVAERVPAGAADMMLRIFQAARQRHVGIVDPALEGILGRPTARLEDVLAQRLT